MNGHRRRTAVLLAALLPALASAGCREGHRAAGPGATVAAGPLVPRFADASAEAGLSFVTASRIDAAGYGQGVAVADVDGDGDLDLFFTQDEGPCALYRNDGGFRFTEVAAGVGVGSPAHAKSAAFLDYDRDGDADLFVGTTGEGNRLYRNRGDGTFEEVTGAAGIGGGNDYTVSAAVGDHDGDGFPDLYLCNFERYDYGGVLGMTGEPAPNRLLHNNGDGTFQDRAAALGVDDPRASWAALWFDIDGDGDQDLVVANDAYFFPGMETRDRVYVNPGVPGAPFEERGADFGMGTGHFGMGIAAGDLDGDGTVDLYVSDMGDNELHLRSGSPPWPDSAGVLRVQNGRDSLDSVLVGWGAAIEDFDRDGHADLLVVNGLLAPTVLPPNVRRQTPALYVSRKARRKTPGSALLGGRELSNVAEAAGLVDLRLHGGRCAVPCDLDGDGDLDLVVSTRVGAARLLRNETPLRGPWYGVRLRGGASTREGLGATLVLTAGHATVVRLLTTGGQPGGCLPPEAILHPGPTAPRSAMLEVRWPSGRVSAREVAAGEWTVVDEP